MRRSLPIEECKIGVLAFQGGYQAHMKHLKQLGVETISVKTKADLEQCDGLILPGGESTTMNHHLKQDGFLDALSHFALTKPCFGTCAGLIILAQQNILPITIARNAYGRQSASFATTLTVHFSEKMQECAAVFIRAPQILNIRDPSVKVLAEYNHQPVFVHCGHHLGATFHPELTSDLSVHSFFVSIVKSK